MRPRASIRSAACWPSAGLTAEPAGAAAAAEVLLPGHLLGRGSVEAAGPLGAGEEVDVDAADPAAAELDVTGAAPEVRARTLPSPQPRDQGLGDDAGRALGEDAGLRHPGGGDVADRV